MIVASEQVPLYLGVSLSALCMAACVFIVLAGVAMWRVSKPGGR